MEAALSFLTQLQKSLWSKDFPGGPMANTPHSHARGPEFDPWSGNQILHASTKTLGGQINILKRKKEITLVKSKSQISLDLEESGIRSHPMNGRFQNSKWERRYCGHLWIMQYKHRILESAVGSEGNTQR